MAGTSGPKADRTAFLVLFGVFLALTVVLVVASIPAGFYAVFSGKLSTSVTYLTPFPLYYWV